MEIQLVGTGSILTNHISACAVVDNKLLVDCPNGAVKAMRRLNIKPTDINVCLITHFHADHYFDIPFLLLEQGIRPVRKTDFTVIGPKYLMEHINELFLLAYPEDWEVIKKQSRIKTIEIGEEYKPIVIDGYSIIPYRVKHSVCDAFGYTISHNHSTVGFTGDTVLCPNVEKMVQKSNLIFADMSFEKGTKNHMGMEDIEYLVSKYGEQRSILPTHMSDNVRIAFSEKHSCIPSEGDIYHV